MTSDQKKLSSTREVIKAMGLVFGDIGTSPIYTLTVIFLITPPTEHHILGILSLVFWTLVVLVTIEYAILAMSLSSKGEGGIIVLKEILNSVVKKGKKAGLVAFAGYLGVALLMGDGVITPAISILSAVEGLELIPGLGHIDQNTIILITIAITVLLFSFQSKGTDKVAASFGPIMIVWFSSLLLSGLFSLINNVEIVTAISPWYAIGFIMENGIAAFFILAEVILCATGGEAIYADMGHLRREPIRKAWYLVFFALVINYLGQGAFVLENGFKKNILFEMIKHHSEFLYVPFLLLTLLATIIASQAMISAMFSLVYQGIRTHIFPLLKVKYTSTHMRSQIYIAAVNWGLLLAVILIILIFKKSQNLAAAYGFAVTGTMLISSIFMLTIFTLKNNKLKAFLSGFNLIINLIFFAAVFTKIPHGGYWSIIIAAVPLLIIQIWSLGNRSVHKAFRSLPIDTYLESFNQLYQKGNILPGTALYFAKDLYMIPPYMVHSTIRGQIIYEQNILLSIATMDKPFGIQKLFEPEITEGLSGLEIQAGYLEKIDITKILEELDINSNVIFYGVDDIQTKKPWLKIFAFIKRVSSNFVQFLDLPYQKLHGVVTRIEV